ncbi:Glycopeptide antibiotics resistance protein [Streptomyces sp. AmelKG-E11A]|nr:Glycopeptide antibiotics resistance protein [Streptomyces sp. AmelKG-E11A]
MTAISEPHKSLPPSPDAPAPVPRGRVLLRVLVATAAFLGLVAFAAVLARLTLTPSPASESIAGANLRPGHSLRQYAEDYTFLAACKQLGGNLLLGAPFGLLLPLLVPRRLRMLRMVLLTAAVMSLVELVQGAIVPGRAFDVDDVILNTSGAFLAYLLLGRRVSRRYHHALARRTAPAATDDGTRPATGPGTVPAAPAAPDDHSSPDARTAPDIRRAPDPRSATDTRPVPDGPVHPGPRLSKPERTKGGAVARAAARLRRRDR